MGRQSQRLRVLARRWPASGRWWPLCCSGLIDAYLVAAEDVPELLGTFLVGSGAVLAVRLVMAAVYLRLVRG